MTHMNIWYSFECTNWEAGFQSNFEEEKSSKKWQFFMFTAYRVIFQGAKYLDAQLGGERMESIV